MKNLTLLGLIFVCSGQLLGQTINADEIIRKARSGEDIRYENVTIEGIVDLTPFLDEKDDLPRKSWFSNWDSKIETTIRGRVTFINCEFMDDFLAYYRDDRSEYTFVSHFDQEVTFRDCTFRRDAAFKYSEFREEADFSNTTFGDNANFKYAEFNDKSIFAGSTFEEDTDFKYFDAVVFSDSSQLDQELGWRFEAIIWAFGK